MTWSQPKEVEWTKTSNVCFLVLPVFCVPLNSPSHTYHLLVIFVSLNHQFYIEIPKLALNQAIFVHTAQSRADGSLGSNRSFVLKKNWKKNQILEAVDLPHSLCTWSNNYRQSLIDWREWLEKDYMLQQKIYVSMKQCVTGSALYSPALPLLEWDYKKHTWICSFDIMPLTSVLKFNSIGK